MTSPPHADPDFAPVDSFVAKEVHPAIAAELAADERLVWVGRPWRRPGAPIVSAASRVLAAVVGAMTASLGLCLISVCRSDPARHPWSELVSGDLIAAAGSGLIVLAFWDLILDRMPEALRSALPDPIRAREEWRERNTFYALTDRRVILWEPAPTSLRSIRVRSFRSRDLSGTSRTQRPDGSGDLALEVVGAQSHEATGPITLGRLRRLEKVREVEALVRATLLPD